MNSVAVREFLPKRVLLETVPAGAVKSIARSALGDARRAAKTLSAETGQRFSVRFAELALRDDLRIELAFFACAVKNPSVRKMVMLAILDDDTQTFDLASADEQQMLEKLLCSTE